MITGKVITNLDQVSIEWLTAVLTKSGALTCGTVASLEVGAGQGNWSTNAKLNVNYTAEARGSLPQRLFLKMVNTSASDADESFNGSEVTYYTRDYVDVQNAPLLQCYDAAFSESLQRYHILLEDVSQSHVVAGEKEPTLEYGLELAEALAVLHAQWWGAKRLAEAGAQQHSAEHIQHLVDIAEPGVGHILKQHSMKLEPHWPGAMRDLFANHPQLMIERTQNDNGFTLIHGDVGHNNILVPHAGYVVVDHPTLRPLYIIDRQPFNWSLTTWLGVYDIAYAIVLDWEIEARRQNELPILKRYYARLIENGVSDYSWEQLYDDYRLCVVMCVYIATEYCRGGVNKKWFFVWLLMLQRSLTACDDLDCWALW